MGWGEVGEEMEGGCGGRWWWEMGGGGSGEEGSGRGRRGREEVWWEKEGCVRWRKFVRVCEGEGGGV